MGKKKYETPTQSFRSWIARHMLTEGPRSTQVPSKRRQDQEYEDDWEACPSCGGSGEVMDWRTGEFYSCTNEAHKD
jgi:hypothetical protein